MSDKGMLRGRVALVTGASRGIGAATARLLAAEGARVGVNYHSSREAAEALVKEIGASGGKALAVKADATDQAQVKAMVAEVEAGLGSVDILVSNAGARFKTVPFAEAAWPDFEAKLLGEAKGAFFACQAVLPSMLSRGSGSIILISSGLSRRPGPGFSSHTMAKSALDGLAKALAFELGPSGIRVNVVAPGLTLTDATSHLPEAAKEASAKTAPLRRNGLPEDVAGAVLMLASDQARMVTGAYVSTGGGALML